MQVDATHGQSSLAEMSILAIAPVFDLNLARTLLNAVDQADAAARLNPSLLEHAGLVVRQRGWWRLAEGVRVMMTRELAGYDPVLLARAVAVMVDELSDASRQTLEAALGLDGLALRTATLATIRDRSAFPSVIRAAQLEDGRGRRGYAEAAARQLSSFPGASHLSREIAFLRGMAEWNVGHRNLALPLFEEVTRSQPEDQAWAIAAHLQAVFQAGEGSLRLAESLAESAVRVLRELGDTRGLIHTLTTVGSIQRELANSRATFGSDGGPDPIPVLEEAVALAQEFSVGDQVAVLTSLASAQDRLGEHDDALATALKAIALFDQTARRDAIDSDAFKTYSTLASILRRNGKAPLALEVLQIGLARADDMNDDHGRARLLNVLASVEFEFGRPSSAESAARESVDLGRALQDEVHEMHASHTLARILARQDPGNEEAVSLALRAMAIAQARHDVRAGTMISNTIERWITKGRPERRER